VGSLAFGNFLWFFQRHGVEATSVASGSAMHMKATAMTYLTIVLCQLFNILQRRSRQGLFTRYQFHNKSLWLAMLLSMFCVVNIIYNPWLAPYFHAGSLTIVDWACALGAAAIFILFREFQRYTRNHSRKAVLTLHQQIHAAKS
jgi:Ca2+-transporting ATPase